jgi:hypothetical protein
MTAKRQPVTPGMGFWEAWIGVGGTKTLEDMEPQAERIWKQARVPKDAIVGGYGRDPASSPLPGPARPRSTCAAPRRPPSAHSEALTGVARVPGPGCHGSQGGSAGRKEPVGPRLPLPSPAPTMGPRLGGGALAEGGRPRVREREDTGGIRDAEAAPPGRGCQKALAESPFILTD